MTSKKWVASVLVVLVGSPFAVAALDAIGIGPNWQVDAPEWEAGYSWTFANSMDMKMEGTSDDWGAQSESFRLVGESKRTVVNTTAELHEVPLYAVVEQWAPRKIVEDGETVYESDEGVGDLNESDEAQAPMGEGFVSHEVCMMECGTTSAYYTREDINPYSEYHGWDSGNELKFLDFPLKHGSSWTVYRDEETSGFGQTLVEEIKARVAGRDVVNLPKVGAMEAIRIEAELTDESVKSVESLVAQIPGMSMSFDIDYRMTYWYAPEAKSIVRFDMDRKEEVSMRYEGERMYFKGEFEMRDVLTDYSLEAMPERSLEESGKLRELLDDLPGVTELSDESWPFTVAASSLSMDVTRNGESVGLGIREGDHSRPLEASQFDTLPDGMSLKWRHRYFEIHQEGQYEVYPVSVEDWYTGEHLDLPLEAGVHQVVVYLLDEEGRLVDHDTVFLEGYEHSELVSGLPVGVSQTGDLAYGFMATLFLDEVRVNVRPGDLGAGELYLYNSVMRSDQESYTTSSNTGPFEVRFDGDYIMPGVAYDAGYRDIARVGDVELDVWVRYDREIDEDEFEFHWVGYENAVTQQQSYEGSSGQSWTAPACSVASAFCLFDGLDSVDTANDLRGSMIDRVVSLR